MELSTPTPARLDAVIRFRADQRFVDRAFAHARAKRLPLSEVLRAAIGREMQDAA
jgi:hypothetical protein